MATRTRSKCLSPCEQPICRVVRAMQANWWCCCFMAKTNALFQTTASSLDVVDLLDACLAIRIGDLCGTSHRARRKPLYLTNEDSPKNPSFFASKNDISTQNLSRNGTLYVCAYILKSFKYSAIKTKMGSKVVLKEKMLS